MYLNCHSYYSFRYGTISIERLVETAVHYQVTSLALTEVNNTSGVFDFVRLCQQAGIKPVVGVEFRNGDEFCYVCLAKDTEGFAEINRFLSQYLLAEKPFPLRPPHFERVWVIYPLRVLEQGFQPLEHELVGVRLSELARFWQLQQRLPVGKWVALQPVTYLDKQGYNLHRLLQAIAHNCLLSKLSVTQQAQADEYFYPPESLANAYTNYPALLLTAQQVLDTCAFDFDFLLPKNRVHFTTARADDLALLTKLTWEGFGYRYGKANRAAKERVEKELKVIDELGFAAYFLMTWDMIRYARSRGFFHVGRGSGANSIVAYCLGITDVEPIELDLYFERFINPHRSSPPDFDIDFSWDERDEIIDYLFKRYGKDYVCLLATYVTFQDKGQYRELGKVFGLPKPEIDELVYQISHGNTSANDDIKRLIIRYGKLLEGFPQQLSIHAGGILIAEKPLAYYTALQPMPKGFPVCQFDMYVAEDIGFAKFDVLSQRGLGHIKTAVEYVRQNQGVDIDIHAIQRFKQDPNIKRQLQVHETMGCFYIESPAMRQLIWKLRCDNYLTLVAASSIIRPGVASSGMMKAYIERHHNPSGFTYIHPKMGELLAETYGVMVYQEDVIKVAHYFAGLTLAEADILRRGMSGKSRSKGEFERIKSKWFMSCQEKAYPDEVAKEVWRQIESFSGYSFSKAHSASFAVESYQSLFLKTYYPLEFMTAVINNFGGYYHTQDYVHEARRWGAVIEAPDINESEALTRIEGKTLWLGWGLVKGIAQRTIQWVMEQRELALFRTIDDFCRRVPIGLEQLRLLIRVGGFRQLNPSKKELLWEAHLKYNRQPDLATTGDLFELPDTHFAYPMLSYDTMEDAYDELELLGFTLASPFDLVYEKPETQVFAANLSDWTGQVVTLLGYYVTYKLTSTKKGERMFFGYFIDEKGAFFDTVHFPKIAQQFPLKGRGVYLLRGKVITEFGHPSLDVQFMEKLPWQQDPRASE